MVGIKAIIMCIWEVSVGIEGLGFRLWASRDNGLDQVSSILVVGGEVVPRALVFQLSFSYHLLLGLVFLLHCRGLNF